MKNEFQKLVDRDLSGLCWNERMRQTVLHSLQKEEEPVKRKMTVGMAFVMVLILLGSFALAAGMMFSPRYDTLTLADNALLETYGITDELLAFFGRTLTKEDGVSTITYRGMEDLQDVTGDYVVTIENGKASARWSLDGIAGGWNAEKLVEVNAICKQQGNCYGDVIALANADAARYQLPSAASVHEVPTEAEMLAQMNKREKESEMARAAAKLTTAEMEDSARGALKERFGLKDQQISKLELVEESCDWHIEEGQKLYSLYYWLSQTEKAWTEDDGIYIVEVNVETGIVEEINYDTGLLGNG